MSTLLDIGSDLLALMALLEESGGEVTDEISDTIDGWFAEFGEARNDKVDAYCSLLREFTLRSEMRKREAERLTALAQTDENAAKRLKDRLKFFMELTGDTKIQTRRFKVSVCGNGGKLPIEIPADASTLPTEYQSVIVAANRDKIAEAIADGLDVPGCRVLPRGTHLRIS